MALHMSSSVTLPSKEMLCLSSGFVQKEISSCKKNFWLERRTNVPKHKRSQVLIIAADNIVNGSGYSQSSGVMINEARQNVEGRAVEWQSTRDVLSSQWAREAQKEHLKVDIRHSHDSDRNLHPTTFKDTLKDLAIFSKPLSITEFPNIPAHDSKLRVAYQGVPGAYSETAANKAYRNCEAVPCDQFEAAFQAVELWLADRAVLPFENSVGGSIHRNYDLLLRHRLHIVGEVQVSVHHCLLGIPGVNKEQLRRVISHPQALAQCEQTLSKLGVAKEAVDDTAGAAQFVVENNLRDTGAIASARAAEIYGLDILADGIQDDCGNVTRFLMLAREPLIPRADRLFKTSIVFALEEEAAPAALFKALSAFALRNINLTKIESRPNRKRPLRVVDDRNDGVANYFENLFFIDFEASMADPRSQNALKQLQESTNFLRVLGSYPMDTIPLKPSIC